jgi:L-threonylcarbamoyladenylate synthase
MEKALVIETIQRGGIGVLPTDTIYGVVASALLPAAVERVYQVRGRRPDKPCIILISAVTDISRFAISIDDKTTQILAELWPGPFSVVLDCPQQMYAYLHRGTNTLAFRLPKNEELQEILRATGPLIAPSANPEGLKPAASTQKAREYFDDRVDFYVDGGIRAGEPSTVVQIKDGRCVVLRQGSTPLPATLQQ